MTTITEFILARVAEREAGARAAYASPWSAGGNPGGHVWTGADDDPEDGPTVYVNGGIYANQRKTAEHIARVADPDRVLAECEAMREIVERLAQAERLCEANAEEHAKASRGGLANQEQITALRTHGWELRGRREALRYMVDVLARLWADHPDFREEWR